MLRIHFNDYEMLRVHGEETYPHECCGVLLGSSASGTNEVRQVVKAENSRTDSAHNRYQIAPAELIRIQRQARAADLDIVGFYHSHPDHPAQWSATDIAEAHWIGCSYLITRVADGKAEVTNSFLLEGTNEEDKHFADESMELMMKDQALV